MFVLGIDPGLSRCGYGLVGRGETDSALRARAAGVIETDPAAPLPQRLLILHTELRALVAEFEPDVVAVERVFFQVNVKTAMSVGQASGLALVAAAEAGLRGGAVHGQRGQAGAGRLRGRHQGPGAAHGGQRARIGRAPQPAGCRRCPGPGRVPPDDRAVAACHGGRPGPWGELGMIGNPNDGKREKPPRTGPSEKEGLR